MESLIQLSQTNLSRIAEIVNCPTYNRDQLTSGIVHIGVGGFHRAHQAYYIHRLLENDEAYDWSICGVGLREADRKIYDILSQQDNLYTLLVKHPNGNIDTQVIGALTDFILGVDDPQRVIDKMAHPLTKIVSMTITEGGYNFNPSSGEFDFENPDIQRELHDPLHPQTVYGYLATALQKRREADLPAFTVLSCDNIQHNGEVTRKMLLSFAGRRDEALAQWIENEVCFPNTMVDRITPATTSTDIDYLRDTYGIQDEWPVTCEPFTQWVIEDNFSNGRPPLEKLGVQFVPDVTPYEKMKIRLLNAGHSVLGILGAIQGYSTIDACMEDPVFVDYLTRFWDREATPVLDELKGVNLTKYKEQLKERFGNPNVKDSLSRICSESSAKLPKFLLPTIQENLANGGSIQFATWVIAAWCYYHDKRINNNHQPIEVIDSMGQELHQAAIKTHTDPLSFLKQPVIFGNLNKVKRFTSLYMDMIQQIYEDSDIRKHMQDVM